MFGIVNFEVFVLSGIILNLTPGIDTMYILGRSISQGRKAGVLSVFGISTGIAVHTLLVSFGLTTVLARSIIIFNIIKFIGAVYLAYLGIRSLISSAENFSVEDKKKDTMLRIYGQGILTNLLNPKVALFILAFLPQFVDPTNHFGPIPFLILGFTFTATATIWTLIVAIFSSQVTKKLHDNPAVTNMLNKLTGVLFIGLGLSLLKQK